MSGYAPGPWVVDAASDDRNVVGVVDASGNPICDMWHGLDGWTSPSKCTTKDWKLDHARLIAVAPDMLDALGAVDDAADHMEFDPDSRFGEALAKVRAAIAKATQA